MAGGGENSDGDMGFQIAPMIDLILVLLVFFMSTVALKQVESELGIQLAGDYRDGDAPKKVEQLVRIDGLGSVSLNDEDLAAPEDHDLPALRSRLKELMERFTEAAPVIIIPHDEVPHARVIDVLNACSASGVKNISFGGS
jgi:biopolymer transport protein ExbD